MSISLILGILSLVIGIIMLVLAIILFIVDNSSWWIWIILILGGFFLILGIILMVIWALTRVARDEYEEKNLRYNPDPRNNMLASPVKRNSPAIITSLSPSNLYY